MTSRREDRGADSKYMKDGPPEKRLNLLFVDLKSKTVTNQGCSLGGGSRAVKNIGFGIEEIWFKS